MELTLTRRSEGAEAGSFRPVAVDSLISGFPFLPPAFELVPRLLLLLDDSDATCEDFADIIRIDPGLTANMLRIAQSAMYGGASRIGSLSEAIMRLGSREVYRLVMEIITSPALKMADAYAFGRIDLWRHSLATAVGAHTLAQRVTDQDPESVFSAALLHDIGKPLLARAIGADYFKLLKLCAETNRSVQEAEQEVFSTDHTEVAGRLLRSWKFPGPIAAAVAGHHSPTNVEDGGLAALIYAGNILAYRINQGNGFPDYAVMPDETVLELIGIKADDLAGYEEEVSENLRREQEKLR
jgi:putative nucleotidyltransferase with HDIG domain